MGKIIGMLKAKKFMTYSHENMIFVNPALIITEEQLREEMVKVDEVLTEVDSCSLSDPGTYFYRKDCLSEAVGYLENNAGKRRVLVTGPYVVKSEMFADCLS